MNADDQIKEAMKLLARAETALQEEFGGIYRPVKDALDRTVKANRDLEAHRRALGENDRPS